METEMNAPIIMNRLDELEGKVEAMSDILAELMKSHELLLKYVTACAESGQENKTLEPPRHKVH